MCLIKKPRDTRRPQPTLGCRASKKCSKKNLINIKSTHFVGCMERNIPVCITIDTNKFAVK
jgi:hypothetical protein